MKAVKIKNIALINPSWSYSCFYYSLWILSYHIFLLWAFQCVFWVHSFFFYAPFSKAWDTGIQEPHCVQQHKIILKWSILLTPHISTTVRLLDNHY